MEELSSAIMEKLEPWSQKKLSVRSGPHGEKQKNRDWKLFYKTGGRQSFVGTVFRDRLEGSGSGLDRDELFELGNPDAFGFKVWHKVASCHGCDMHTDAAFFLRETATVDFGSANGLGPCDAALSRHKMDGRR